MKKVELFDDEFLKQFKTGDEGSIPKVVCELDKNRISYSGVGV